MADEEIAGLAIKIAMDSSGFNQGNQDIKKQLQILSSDFKANTAELGNNGTALDKLKLQQSNYSKQVELQSTLVQRYSDALDKSKNTLNKNAAEMLNLKNKMEDAKKAWQDSKTAVGENDDETQKLEKAYKNLNIQYDNSASKVKSSEKSVQGYTIQLNNSRTALGNMQSQLDEVNKKIDIQSSKWTALGSKLNDASGKMTEIGGKIDNVGSSLTKGVTLPLVAVGAGLTTLGTEFDDAYDKIQQGTGNTGDALKGLQDDFKSVAKEAPSSFDDISTAITDYNKRLDLSGEALQELSVQTLNLSRMTGTDLTTNIEEISQAFQAFNVKSKDYGDSLDYIYKVSQFTGVGMETLLGDIKNFAPALKDLGLNFEASATLIGQLDKSGVNVEQTLGGLTKAIANMAKKGITDANKAVQELFDNIKNAPSDMAAANEAVGTFGAKAGPALASAIREGKLSYTDLMDSIKGNENTINGMANETDDWAEGFLKLKNNLAVALEPLAGSFFDAVNNLVPVAQNLLEKLTGVINVFADMSPAEQEMILKTGLAAAAIGPLLSAGGKVVTIGGGIAGALGKAATSLGIASAASEGAGAAAGAAAAGLGEAGTAAGAASLLFNPLTLGVLAVGAAGVGTAYLLNQKVIPTVDLFGGTVSDATQKSVTSYMDMNTKVETSLLSFQANNTIITKEMADNMVSTFDNMGKQIKEGNDKHYAEDLANLTKFYTDQGTLNTKDAQDTLAKAAAAHVAQGTEIDTYEAQIKDIYLRAANNHRQITQSEADDIKAIQSKMEADAITALTNSEEEQNAIRTRMRLQAGNISDLEAADVIKASAKQRDTTISLANDQYAKTVETISRQRDEGVIASDDQAKKMIDAAERTRDQAIQKAKDMHKGVVDELESQNGDIAKKLNTSDGTVKTWWNKLSEWFDAHTITPKINASGPAYLTGQSNSSSGSNSYPAVGHNASGSDNYVGGYTTLHENGYEIYDLPQGTKIYNHDASEDLVLKTAQEVAKNVIAANQNNKRNVPQTLILNLTVDGKTIATVSAPYADVIQGNNLNLAGRGQGIK